MWGPLLCASVTMGVHVAVVGSHGVVGRVAVERARFHGFDVTAVTPASKSASWEREGKRWRAILVDGTKVSPFGVHLLQTHYPSCRVSVMRTRDDAVLAADAVFGQTI